MEQDIVGNYTDGTAFEADEKTKGYWLNITGSSFEEDIIYDIADNAQSNGYRYVYFTVPIYVVNYNGFGVTFSYRTTYGTSIYFSYLRR